MAIRLDAAGDSLSRTTNLPTITSWTMMGWFKLSADTNAFATFLSFGQNAASLYYQLSCNQTGATSRLELWNAFTTVTGSNLSLSTWYHLALTCAGTTAGLVLGYLNGALDITASGDTNPTNAKMWVGNDPDGDLFNGAVQAVKIYDAVLTAAEIVAEMGTVLPQRVANGNGWYPMTDGAIADCSKDFGGLGRDWTVGGTLAREPGGPVGWSRPRRRLLVPAAAAAPSTYLPWDTPHSPSHQAMVAT